MRVVGIGASAGGMEALAGLLTNLPVNTGAAFVLVQHLSPDHESIMDKLLARYTAMPISVVEEYTRIEPNHIYLISKNKNLTFDRGMLVPQHRSEKEVVNLPIDLFFHSLGEQLKEKAIGVILSGTGTDGSRGARTIKEAGGMVLVQSPSSARFDGMPKSVIRLQLADRVMSPEDLAHMLEAVLTMQNGHKGGNFILDLDDDGAKTYFELILNRVSSVTGIDFSAYREATLNRRLNNRILLHRFSDPEVYYDYLCKNDAEAIALHKDFLIGVTRFFRNPEAFIELENNVYPQIFQGNIPDNTVRVWIPACSTGEEAYSMALTMARYLEDNDLDYDFKIFGTDVDSVAVGLASEGVFPYSIAADIPSELLLRYFSKDSDSYRIKPELRDRMLFAVHNLLADPPFIHIHLISCRNLLIYFKPAVQRGILSTFHFVLNQGGFLMLGPSESLGDIKHAFVKMNRKWNIFQKKDDTQLPFYPRTLRNNETELRSGGALPAKRSSSLWEDKEIHDNYDPFTAHMLKRYVPRVLFLNGEMDIIYTQGDLDDLLTFPRRLATLNLQKMLEREVAVIFKNGITRALSSDKPILYRNVIFQKGEQQQNTKLRFRQTQIPEYEDALVMVEIMPENEQPKPRQFTEEISKSTLIDDHIRTLEQELLNSRRHTQQLISELESINEELQASNRELMAANEELQSTNEELQSVNEELYTVNIELQSKNEDLTTANDDINNLLRSTEIGTIFLDADLNIRKFTPAIRRQFELIDADIGRPITNFSSTFEDLDIGQISRRVFDTLDTFEQEVEDTKGNRYLLRILPYRTENDHVKGLVITFVDVSELTAAREQSRTLANKFQTLFESTDDVIIVMDEQGRVSRINNDLGPFSSERITGNSLFDFLPQATGETVRATLAQVYQDKRAVDLMIQIGEENDQVFHYDVCMIPVSDLHQPDKKVINALMIMKDITENYLTRRRLEKALSEYRAFMDNAVHQIALVDRQGVIRHINYTRHTGVSKEAMIGTRIYDYLAEDQHDKVAQVIRKVFAGQASSRLEFEFTYRDGRKGLVELIATPVIVRQNIKYVALIGLAS